MWGFPTIESIFQDLRYGARSLRRSPIFTAVAVLSIAGGLAAGTGIFAFTNAVIFRPSPSGTARVCIGFSSVIGAAHAGYPAPVAA
jgi:hypothetical protein